MRTSDRKFMPNPVWLYVIGWGLFLYIFIYILSFGSTDSNNTIVMGMYFINFGIHEVAHLALMFLPQILVAAAGSISEIIFALTLLYVALKEKSYFAATFTGLWVMFSFTSAGRYMSDARAQTLPLIGPGEVTNHDWYYVFSQLGWLNNDTLIGGGMRMIGIAIGVSSLVFGIYLIVAKLYRAKAR